VHRLGTRVGRRLCLVGCALAGMLAACGEQTAPQQTAAVPAAPADPALVQLYEQTCKTCHGVPGTGAPLTGDRAAWAPRMAQGMDTLLDHTINGLRGMPPLGSCGDCSEEEFVALIRYMSGAP
jgi:cytochrome c5